MVVSIASDATDLAFIKAAGKDLVISPGSGGGAVNTLGNFSTCARLFRPNSKRGVQVG
jgi:hypothetical protein